MSDHTKIQWTESTWNCIRGCSRVSRGCGSSDGGGCYAERMAHRFSGPGQPYEGLTRLTKDGPRWTGKVRLVPEALDLPLHWQKPRRVFVNSMSDLFHPEVPNEFIEAIFGVMSLAGRHTFQVLTKRPERMRTFLSRATLAKCQAAACVRGVDIVSEKRRTERADEKAINGPWPLPNVWMGVSAEDQRAAETRVPVLLATPVAVRFLSCEPLLGSMDLREYLRSTPDCGDPYHAHGACGSPGLDWVIVGCESGPKGRPMNEDWVRSLRDQCISADVKFFYKQKLNGHHKVSIPELDGRCWMGLPTKRTP